MRRPFPPALLLATVMLPGGASAQSLPTAGAPVPSTRPDIEFAADVHMDSIRFDGTPRARVTFTGGDGVATRHDVERTGLPKPVSGGATYRNVDVRTTIAVTLLDLNAPAPPPSPDDQEDSP